MSMSMSKESWPTLHAVPYLELVQDSSVDGGYIQLQSARSHGDFEIDRAKMRVPLEFARGLDSMELGSICLQHAVHLRRYKHQVRVSGKSRSPVEASKIARCGLLSEASLCKIAETFSCESNALTVHCKGGSALE